MAKTENGYRTELAGYEMPSDWEKTARDWFQLPEALSTSVEDPKRGSFRIALSDGPSVLAVLFISREPVTLMREYLATLPDAEPHRLLSGRSANSTEDGGPIICSCFGVGLNTIIQAIGTQNIGDIDDIGRLLQAGTNCGSCRPELSGLLAKHSVPILQDVEP